jgi:hypothetical protein
MASSSTAWSRVFKTNDGINERIRAYDRPARRAPQPQIPGPIYQQVIRGDRPAPAAYPTMAKPYPWVTAPERQVNNDPIVGYLGHRPRKREAFSQSTFLPIQRAALVADPWSSTYSVNFTGHKEEVERLAQARSQNILDRWETMRTLSASVGSLSSGR